MKPNPSQLPEDFIRQVRSKGLEFGFQAIGISDVKLDDQHQNFHRWLRQNYQGEMDYMARNIDKRLQPRQLVSGTLSVISARMDYLTQPSQDCIDLLDHPHKAYVSRYALGRDYHKLIRKRLQQFATSLSAMIGEFGYRVFTDSAPVLEKAIAAKSGLGWLGKHSNILNRQHGSWFFLGEIFTDLPLPADSPTENHCGNCTACIDKCPTDAIVKPYVVDARRCISYLTIEHHSAIPVEYRAAIGNRIYGCDDCQLYCPWNRFEKISAESDYQCRHGLDDISMLDCFSWTEQQFLDRFAGSPIRRIGYLRWQRNIAVALGNAAFSPHIIAALEQALSLAPPLLAEHLQWALQQQRNNSGRT